MGPVFRLRDQKAGDRVRFDCHPKPLAEASLQVTSPAAEAAPHWAAEANEFLVSKVWKGKPKPAKLSER